MVQLVGWTWLLAARLVTLATFCREIPESNAGLSAVSMTSWNTISYFIATMLLDGLQEMMIIRKFLYLCICREIAREDPDLVCLRKEEVLLLTYRACEISELSVNSIYRVRLLLDKREGFQSRKRHLARGKTNHLWENQLLIILFQEPSTEHLRLGAGHSGKDPVIQNLNAPQRIRDRLWSYFLSDFPNATL